MNDEIEKIQQKLEQLSQKQLELAKARQQQSFLYRWLQQSDPELQAVNSQIEDLEEQRREYFKILQAAASIPPPVPEKDWSKSPFYSHTLKSWNFDYPVMVDRHWNCVDGSLEVVEHQEGMRDIRKRC